MTETRLIVFAKAPVPGRVKTRLVPPLSEEEAAAVHRASLMDVVGRARRVRPDLLIRYDAAPGSCAFFAEVFPDLERRPQGSGNLGARLELAFAQEFDRGAGRVVIIGSDSPTLPEKELEGALSRLARSDVVLGPALDGGYYLIALRRATWPEARALFREMPWSTERVLAETLRRLKRTRLKPELLTPWYDIDRADDLLLAAHHAAPGSHLGRILNEGLMARLAAARVERMPI